MNDIKSITYKYTNTLRQLQISLIFIITIKNTLNMASNYTTYKKSVPYNTIRLSGDVAQWSKYEESYLDNSSVAGKLGLSNSSMKSLQLASNSSVDPDGGIVSDGILSNMRYGVSIESDQSTTDGVYSSQIWSGNNQGNNNDFLSNRSYNSSANPQNVRLSRLAQWDYTAFVEPSDLDFLEIEEHQSAASYTWQCNMAQELFIDQPFTIAMGRNNSNSSQRYIYLIRSNVTGDKYSLYTQNNVSRVTKPSTFVNINVVCPMTSSWSSKNDSRNLSSNVLFAGSRNTSNSSNVTLQAYNVYLNNNTAGGTAGGFTLAESTNNTITFGGSVGSNAVPGAACFSHSYMQDVGAYSQHMALLVDKGNGPLDLHHIIQEYNISNNEMLHGGEINIGAAGRYAQRGDVAHAYVAGEDLVFAAWCESKSTYNRYTKFEAFSLNDSLNGGITNESYQSSPSTIIDASNQLKTAKLCLLHSEAQGADLLVATSDTSGDIRLNVVQYVRSTKISTSVASTTFQFNNSSITNAFSLSALSAVEVTALGFTGQGNDFVPGGTNNFKKRIYFVVTGTIGGSYNSDKIGYYYFDKTNGTIVSLGDGTPSQTSRGLMIARKNYQGQRDYTIGAPLRGGAQNPWTTIVGGMQYTSGGQLVTYLGVAALAMDFKPNWGNGNTSNPPNDLVYDLDGVVFTNDVSDTRSDTSTAGRYNVVFPHPSSNFVAPSTSGYSWMVSNSTNGTTFASVGPNLTQLTVSADTVSGTDFTTWLYGYIYDSWKGGDDLEITISTDNGNLNAIYQMPAYTSGVERVQWVTNVGSGTEYLVIDWGGVISNSHSGDSWSFINNSEPDFVTAAYIEINLA